MTKLTEAQRRELREMGARSYRSYYADDYKPICRLLELGYVDRQEDKWGSSTYAITDAGRAALIESAPDRGTPK
jgi:hypothetical protein